MDGKIGCPKKTKPSIYLERISGVVGPLKHKKRAKKGKNKVKKYKIAKMEAN